MGIKKLDLEDLREDPPEHPNFPEHPREHSPEHLQFEGVTNFPLEACEVVC